MAKRKTLTSNQKKLWNEAIRKATNELYLYDGVIPDERERKEMRDAIRKKLYYKLNPNHP